MSEHTEPRRPMRRIAAVGATAVLAVIGIGLAGTADAAPETAPATATVSRQAHVVGTLTPWTGRPNVWHVSGDLVGTYVYHADQEKVLKSWVYGNTRIRVIAGRETMSGYLDYDRDGYRDTGEPIGSVNFSFKRLAAFDRRTDALITSDCVHPVISSNGAYSGGFVTMSDDPTGYGNDVHSTYDGYLTMR